MSEPTDAVDRVLAGWRSARPDLDPAPLGLIGRVLVLAGHLEKSVTAALEPHGLTLGQFDILATLRRHGPNGGLTPGDLLKSIALTSGGMTSRLDKLEQAGLIAREPDPADRRGVMVKLTPRGRKRIDAAAETRFAEATMALPPLATRERKELERLLRTWLAGYE